jgi:hypothetical protein
VFPLVSRQEAKIISKGQGDVALSLEVIPMSLLQLQVGGSKTIRNIMGDSGSP